jgi:hypothetical protein
LPADPEGIAIKIKPGTPSGMDDHGIPQMKYITVPSFFVFLRILYYMQLVV